MMSGTRSMCMFSDIRPENSGDGCRRLRLTLHGQPQPQPQPTTGKPIGRAFALVQPTSERQPLKTEPIKAEENVEVIKVYLKAQKQEQNRNSESLKMLSDEVSQIQEVRYCLRSLREQMKAKNNHRTEQKLHLVRNGLSKSTCSLSSTGSLDDLDEDCMDEQERAKIREVSKRLYTQMQEAEKKHQEEKDKLQAEAGQYKQQLSEQSDQLKEAKLNAQQQDQQIKHLERLIGSMEQESSTLREKLMTKEIKVEGRADNDRREQLEKDNAILKEKIHHLDDMLKSQQRKLRQMIEQLQNSRMIIQERDRTIKELEEKVTFLEAENREMRDQIDYYLGNQGSTPNLFSDSSAQIVYSKPLKPSTRSNKSLPFIKVIEIKS